MIIPELEVSDAAAHVTVDINLLWSALCHTYVSPSFHAGRLSFCALSFELLPDLSLTAVRIPKSGSIRSAVCPDDLELFDQMRSCGPRPSLGFDRVEKAGKGIR